MPKFNNDDKWIEKLANYMISKFWDISKYKIKNPKFISAIFLAWAPWAWKTEFLNTIFSDLKQNFIVINVDKYRKYFNWYNWENSCEYQDNAVKVANKILKYCFKNNLNFIFDWTFRSYNKAKQNFWQCIKYNRISLITLIFQEPRISFYYTFLRKLKKSRNVPIDIFIDWFYNSISTIFKILNEYDKVDLMIAHKKYHPLNKDLYTYKMDYKITNIIDFCKKYRILYEKWKFLNKEKVKLDLEKFQNILIIQFFWWNNSIFWRIKIKILEKLYKL